MQQYLFLQNGVAIVFRTENYEDAIKHVEELGGNELSLQPIKGVQLQHEIAFEICKELKKLHDEAWKDSVH